MYRAVLPMYHIIVDTVSLISAALFPPEFVKNDWLISGRSTRLLILTLGTSVKDKFCFIIIIRPHGLQRLSSRPYVDQKSNLVLLPQHYEEPGLLRVKITQQFVCWGGSGSLPSGHPLPGPTHNDSADGSSFA